MALSLATKRPLTNQLSYLIKIFPIILEHESAVRFSRPVDHVAFDIPDYPIIVKYPMDMQCVYDRLQMQFYANLRDCLADIAQVFTNCFVYCSPDESIIEEALQLHRFVQDKLCAIPEKEGRKKPISQPPQQQLQVHVEPEPIETRLSREMELCLQVLNRLGEGPTVPETAPGLHIDVAYIGVNLEKGAYADKVEFARDVYLMINTALLGSSTSPETAKKCWAFEEEFAMQFLNTFGERCDTCLRSESVYVLTRALRTQRNISSLIYENGLTATGHKQQVEGLVSMLEKRDCDAKFSDSKKGKRKSMLSGTIKDHHSSSRMSKVNKY